MNQRLLLLLFFATIAVLSKDAQSAPQTMIALLGGGTGARGTGPDASQIAAGVDPYFPNWFGTMTGWGR
ncbi:hypothetical protein DdX_04202 [Ditylenchus destructor]|uniref:Uncharacterized protein n=1 Tax=Ditylenchus destructor TaxID=166010 RepID=A0AAD4NE21_9BILA|nr:hypothetical protein DdX_04202 [Ditylenchus destructor]